MPGHKFGRISPLGGIDLYKIDTTEVDISDNLHYPNSIIKEAQDRASELYESIQTFFLINGSSCGLLAAISSCNKKGDKILVARNCHKSVYNGIFLNQLDPIYVYPQIIKEYNLLGGIKPNDVKLAFEKNPDIKCVIITSPTYEGFTSDIQAIADITHKYNALLIVDEAHGAHFPFSNYFPKSALKYGADIVIHSIHKTLPAFTQSALLHVNSESVNLRRLKDYLAIYQTSSPSYILMTGIDSCIRFLQQNSEHYYREFVDNLKNFRNNVDKLKDIKLIGSEMINKYAIQSMDLSKLVIVGKNASINGKKLNQRLRNDFNIQMEMCMLNGVLGITTISDDYKAFQYLYKSLKAIEVNSDYKNIKKFDIINISHKKYNIHEVEVLEQEEIDLLNANQRISNTYITVYPPGIPLIVPGEIITEKIINIIKDYLANDLTILGIENNKLNVIRE